MGDARRIDVHHPESRGVVAQRVADRTGCHHLQIAICGDVVPVPVAGQSQPDAGRMGKFEHSLTPLDRKVPVVVALVGRFQKQRVVSHQDDPAVIPVHLGLEPQELLVELTRDQLGVVQHHRVHHYELGSSPLERVVVRPEDLSVLLDVMRRRNQEVGRDVVVPRGPLHRDVRIETMHHPEQRLDLFGTGRVVDHVAAHDNEVRANVVGRLHRHSEPIGVPFVALHSRNDLHPHVALGVLGHFFIGHTAEGGVRTELTVGKEEKTEARQGLSILERRVDGRPLRPAVLPWWRREQAGTVEVDTSRGAAVQYRIQRSADGGWIITDITRRGHAVAFDPILNKGTAFSAEERRTFGLEGMLPTQRTTRDMQVRRAYEHIQAKGDNDLEKYVGMVALQDRNETLFYQLLAEHVEELIPIVYTPTVGEAAVGYSHMFRRGRGLWITPEHRGRIAEVLENIRNEEVRLIVVTDNERILGLGDQGAGGMVIPIGKLALYTLAAGIHPAYTLPVSLDVGTDNPALLEDDLYVGWRHPRLRGDEYFELVSEFVDAVATRWPTAVLQWEDFKKANAFRLLDRYRDRLPSFNDDIQGTAAVVAAGVMSYCRAMGTKLEDQRFLFIGAGAAGVGTARLIRHALANRGVAGHDMGRSIVVFDSTGPLIETRHDLEPYKESVALTEEAGADLGIHKNSTPLDAIDALRPTILIGTTGQPGLFTSSLLSALIDHVERPLVMALSNPTSKCEAHPKDIAKWTEGRAFIATGSPYQPVAAGGRRIPVSQCNNVYIFPGVGLGAMAAKATKVTDTMFATAANALAEQVHAHDLRAGRLYPPLSDLRSITREIGRAVAEDACQSGVGRAMCDEEIEAALDREIWDLDYPELQPA